MTEDDVRALQALPAAKTCFRIDFEQIEITSGFVPDTFFLTVSGTKPWITMTVTLSPVIYTHQPEYWDIEVVGCQAGMGLPALGTYSETIDISHTRGTKGIRVVGATREEPRDI